MKKYIRVCMCCGNTFETDIPAFHIAADGAIYRTNYNTLCKSCNSDFEKGKITVANFKRKMIPLDYPVRRVRAERFSSSVIC